METLQSLFVSNWTPRYPMATDNWRDGVKIYTREEALQKKHIELSPKAAQNWFVMDFDIPDAETHIHNLISSGSMPAPNFQVVNPKTGHAHTWMLLEYAVCGQKALDYRKHLMKKAALKWKSDPNYVNRFARNPFQHNVEIFHGEHTSLRTLSEALKEVTLPKTRKPKESSTQAHTEGMGRNSTMFELLRHFTYTNFHTYRTNKEGLMLITLEKAYELNMTHNSNNLLSNGEVERIVNSSVNWTHKTFTENFHKAQKRRNAKSVTARRELAKQKYLNIKEYLEADFTLQEACESLNLNYNSVRKTSKQWETLYSI